MTRVLSAIIIAFISVYVTNASQIANANFLAKFFGFIFSLAASYYGFMIGEKVRNALQPDYVLTDGRVTSIAKAKLFWAIGPQLIATFLAAIIATMIFFKIFGPSAATVQQRKVAEQVAVEEQWKRDHPQEAAQIAQAKAERERQDAEDQAQFKKSQAREELLDQSALLRSEFGTANSNCIFGKARSAERTEWDALNQRTVTIPATPNEEEASCVEADKLLKQIRDKGTCIVNKEGDPLNPDWALCSETNQ
ncbi:DUF4407 domain-containing protein [Novosphingobium sp. TCA1]|uniref:DUF4407 domain-containing protein n=1 Tax=Novosphingobium sp. TCA1 TaxID=2682474 RepID=UPI00130C2E24|nr:hypothetical protein [Novosphingobium sp. TCA1]GFE77836.1 hypothetical protein NTCA1_54850 [Novosphingobium sp. TCA1]